MKKNFDVGLRIVIQKSSHSNENSNVVVFAKSTLKYNNPQFTSKPCTPPRARSADYDFLKSCYLCNKKLRVDKDIYMYRGDQGFCSKECRSKQIEIDEKREIETSTKHTQASIRYHRTTARCDTEAHQDRKNGAIFL